MLDCDDANHHAAGEAFTHHLEHDILLTHSYVVLEATALAQRRLGMDAVRVLVDDLVPAIDMVWVDEGLHQDSLIALLALGRRQVSLVDAVSFQVMRRRGIRHAFCFDADFAELGFGVLPAHR